MKQKLKNLLKKKPARLTIDKMIIDPAFTVLTDEQKAEKKAGVADDPLNRNGFENSNFGLANNSGFNPTNNNLGGGGNNSLSSGIFKIVDGIPIAYSGPDVIIRDTRINKPTSPQFPNFPTHPNIPHWPTPPIVVTPYTPPAETVPSPAPVPDANFKYEWSITPHGAIQNTTVGANKTDFFEDEEARKRSEKYKHLTTKYWDSSAFETTAERSDYYRWVNKQLEGKSKWFGAAAIVTEAYAVSATKGLNGPFLNDAAKTLLKEGSEKLFSRNKWEAYYMIYEDRMHNLGFDDGNNIGVSFKGKKREDLDYTLVKYEQTRLNLILREYKKKNPISEVNSAIKSINEAMGSPRAPQEVREVMDEHFNVKKGQKAYDFSNYDDRVKLGQGIIDKLYTPSVKADPIKPADKFPVNPPLLPDGSNLGSSLTGPETKSPTSVDSKLHVANPAFMHNGSTKLYDAMVNMVSSIDLTLSGTEAAAKALSVELPKYMKIAGKFAVWTGPVDNLGQMITHGFNWNDAAQLAGGVALIGFSSTLGAPVVFVGGLGLFVWELAETYNSQPQN